MQDHVITEGSGTYTASEECFTGLGLVQTMQDKFENATLVAKKEQSFPSTFENG